MDGLSRGLGKTKNSKRKIYFLPAHRPVLGGAHLFRPSDVDRADWMKRRHPRVRQGNDSPVDNFIAFGPVQIRESSLFFPHSPLLVVVLVEASLDSPSFWLATGELFDELTVGGLLVCGVKFCQR
jgi:hypothetical protein